MHGMAKRKCKAWTLAWMGAFFFLVLCPRWAQAAEARLRVVLVLDASGSMAANDPQRLVRTAAKMLSDLADERDHVTVLSFGSSVKRLGAKPGSEHDALRAAINTLGRNESCTDYAQALEAAAGNFDDAPGKERRVVLFLTDGRFEPLTEKGNCGGWDTASDEQREPIQERIDRSVSKLKERKARVFTIALGRAPATAPRSAALLRQVAASTSGRFVQARRPRDVPTIFANIFGALVGAPVLQQSLVAGGGPMRFDIPGGASGVHVVLVPEQPNDLKALRLEKDGKALTMEPPRLERSSGYSLARVKGGSGSYRLQGNVRGRVEVLVVPDVGLALRFEGIRDVIPLGEALRGKVALRTRSGEPVRLARDFLKQVRFSVTLNSEKMGSEKLFEAAPGSTGAARFDAGARAKGRYQIHARVHHRLGFLDVKGLRKSFRVEPRFNMAIATETLRFDTMAETGQVAAATLELKLPKDLPTNVPVRFVLPKEAAKLLLVTPARFEFKPGGARMLRLALTWKNPEQLRGHSQRFEQPLSVVPDPAREGLLVGEKRWQVPVSGRLRAWTWRRYVDEYRWQLAGALAFLLLVLWLIGRAVARKFPAKARVHYREVGIDFASDSLIKRFAKHGAFRSATFSFPLGKNARPLVTFVATGARFEVHPKPGQPLSIEDELLPPEEREKTEPFAGVWDQPYRLGDTYVVWLSRR